MRWTLRLNVCALCLIALPGCGREIPEREYPYETIRFVPYDATRSEIEEDRHSFRGIGFVLPETPGAAVTNPLVASVPTNRFESGTGACETYLGNADPKQAVLAIRVYNSSIGELRVPRVAGFEALCVRVSYLGSECEKAIDEATERAMSDLREAGQVRELQKSSGQSIGAVAVVVAMKTKLEQCYPEERLSGPRTFWVE